MAIILSGTGSDGTREACASSRNTAVW
ncbi:MAG: hypothetical protein V9H25_16505 [Candidatus Competibacter sp.]